MVTIKNSHALLTEFKEYITMHIAITTLPGYSLQEKQLLARELKETAAALLGVAAVTVSVSVKDLPIEGWNEFIRELPDDEIIVPEVCKGQPDCSC